MPSKQKPQDSAFFRRRASRWPTQPSVPLVDRFLSRVANLAQLGLLILAIFGYWYTVLPVYQKALLDEEIAQKVIELNQKERELTLRDRDLAQKSSQLASLNAAISSMRETISKSYRETALLRGALSSQYSELRVQLAGVFEGEALKLCSVDKLQRQPFSGCIKDNVLSNDDLKYLTESDRLALLKLARSADSSIATAWQEAATKFSDEKNKADDLMAQAEERCKERKNSEDYKDNFKKITIDFKCTTDAAAANQALLLARIDSLGVGEKTTAPFLERIATDFVNK